MNSSRTPIEILRDLRKRIDDNKLKNESIKVELDSLTDEDKFKNFKLLLEELY